MGKRRIPYFMRRHISCPSCGYVGDEPGKWNNVSLDGNYLTCPKCSGRFDFDDLIDHHVIAEDVDRIFN